MYDNPVKPTQKAMQAGVKPEWKVLSTHFGKLECALNDLSADGFSVWKLIVLSPESTRTKRFVVIVIGRRQQSLRSAEEITVGENLEFDAGEIYFIDAKNLNAENRQSEPRSNQSGNEPVDQIAKRYIEESEIKNRPNQKLTQNLSPGIPQEPSRKQSAVKPWEGMLRDPAGRSTRRTGRFEVRDEP